MTLKEQIKKLSEQYSVVSVIDLDPWHDLDNFQQEFWLRKILSDVHKDCYENNERIILTLFRGDLYKDQDAGAGSLLMQLQRQLNDIDISNYFVILLTTDVTVSQAYEKNYKTLSHDVIPINIIVYSEEITTKKITGKNMADDNTD